MNFQSKVIKYLEEQGYYVINLIRTNKNGIADLIALKDGSVIFVECKAKGDTVKPLQLLRGLEVSNAGAQFFIANEVEDWQKNISTRTPSDLPIL